SFSLSEPLKADIPPPPFRTCRSTASRSDLETSDAPPFAPMPFMPWQPEQLSAKTCSRAAASPAVGASPACPVPSPVHRVALSPVPDLRLPGDLAAVLVERDERPVELADEDLPFADPDPAAEPAAAHRVDLLADARVVLPADRAAVGVDREDVVLARRHVEHPVVVDRLPLRRVLRRGTRLEIGHPDPLDVLHVRGVDL